VRYRVLLSKNAFEFLKSSPQREGFKKKLMCLEDDPFTSRPGADIKRLGGTKPQKHRMRLGRYRAVYVVEGADVKVIEICKRSNVYDELK